MAATPVTTVYNLDHKTKLTKPAFVACDATNGNSAPSGGNLMLELKNSGASTYTVTFSPNPSTVDGQAIAPLVISLAAAEVVEMGGWPPSYWGTTLVFTANNVAVQYIAKTV
jgi:hypothetical protein